MHGFSRGDFGFLEGLTVTQVRLGQFETQLHFETGTSISLEGRYVHRIGPEGREVVQARSSCGPNELYRLLGATITEAVVSSVDTLSLKFSNSDWLILIDDSEQYESFVIGSGGALIVI